MSPSIATLFNLFNLANDAIDRNELVLMGVNVIKNLQSQLSTDNFTDDVLDEIEAKLNILFSYYSQIAEVDIYRSTGVQSFNVAAISADCYQKLDNKRQFNKKHPFIAYPPEHVFPRNPNLAQFLEPQIIKDETYKDDGTGLKFEFGFAGSLNVIRTKFPPYLDRKFYNFSAKVWAQKQIVITIDGNQNVVDVTPYFSNSVVNFSGSATGINDKIVYFFDGEKLITNFDFSNVENRKKVRIKYKKLLNSLRVKAVLKNNTPGLSFQTPVVDQYTLLVDKQRVLS